MTSVFDDADDLPTKGQPRNYKGAVRCGFCYRTGGTLKTAAGNVLVHADACFETFTQIHGVKSAKQSRRDRRQQRRMERSKAS